MNAKAEVGFNIATPLVDIAINKHGKWLKHG